MADSPIGNKLSIHWPDVAVTAIIAAAVVWLMVVPEARRSVVPTTPTKP